MKSNAQNLTKVNPVITQMSVLSQIDVHKTFKKFYILN